MICAASASKPLLVSRSIPTETILTAGFTTTHSTVGRIVQIAAYVADFGVDEALARKVPTVEVLRAPEAACCDGAALCAVGDGRGGGVGDGEARGLGEGAGEPGDEGRERHCVVLWLMVLVEEDELMVQLREDMSV